MTAPLDLNALRTANDARRQRKDAATPGLWRYRQSGNEENRNVTRYVETTNRLIAECNFVHVDNEANVLFICTAKNDPVENHVTALIAEVERLQSEVQLLRDQAARHRCP